MSTKKKSKKPCIALTVVFIIARGTHDATYAAQNLPQTTTLDLFVAQPTPAESLTFGQWVLVFLAIIALMTWVDKTL